jgi:hypothetical protein
MIRPATYADLLTFYQSPVPAYVLERDGKLLACGGIFERDGRSWAYFDVAGQVSQAETLAMMRALRRGIAALGREVSITCDEGFETAPRMLRLLGFKATDETFNGMRVWKCQA